MTRTSLPISKLDKWDCDHPFGTPDGHPLNLHNVNTLSKPAGFGGFQGDGMARPPGESSNAIFEELKDWEHQLKSLNVDFDKLEGPEL